MDRVPDQLCLFTRPSPSARAAAHCLDLAWMLVQLTPYLTEERYGDVVGALAYARERIIAVTYVERAIRGLVTLPPHSRANDFPERIRAVG